ncbi:MAG: OmpA family protein [Bdellovibrionales bacterium]|nr:OmpA family protein [Bdellovibrionales bacterium]
MARPLPKPPVFGKGPKASASPLKLVPLVTPKKDRVRIRTVYHVQDDGEGNWLVSYADMMTLLFGFFVMLSAFSVPDAAKMEAMKRETSAAMGGKYTKPFEQLTNSIQRTLAEALLDKEVSVTQTDEGVMLVSKGTLFFDSGSAGLKPEAAVLMEKIGDVLAREAQGFRIVVEGHTDDIPISSHDFPSNWELSSMRAGSVVRLLEAKGLPRKDLRPQGLADTEPVAPNHDANGEAIPANQAANRRVVIRVQKQLPPRVSEGPGPSPAAQQ